MMSFLFELQDVTFLLPSDILSSEQFPTEKCVFIASLAVVRVDNNHMVWCFLPRWRYLVHDSVSELYKFRDIQTNRNLLQGKMQSIP